ncbi:unnamed protein product [Albugo candida]|uniref:Uncharacterized protein n=1 Tax=Albugo candida TaxID=65357 RepID=A0A024FXP5_9STRA|nr:unnamed protein product [Albugo candida]|eukprot:CCI11801.1 unnamed protein product [Albugo candida]
MLTRLSAPSLTWGVSVACFWDMPNIQEVTKEGHMSKATMNNTAAIPYECGASDDLHCEVYNSGVGMSEWENMHEEGDVETDK